MKQSTNHVLVKLLRHVHEVSTVATERLATCCYYGNKITTIIPTQATTQIYSWTHFFLLLQLQRRVLYVSHKTASDSYENKKFTRHFFTLINTIQTTASSLRTENNTEVMGNNGVAYFPHATLLKMIASRPLFRPSFPCLLFPHTKKAIHVKNGLDNK